jgi:hypothetical protein
MVRISITAEVLSGDRRHAAAGHRSRRARGQREGRAVAEAAHAGQYKTPQELSEIVRELCDFKGLVAR